MPWCRIAVAALLLGAPARPLAASPSLIYTVLDLGTLPGGTSSTGLGLSEDGKVTGFSIGGVFANAFLYDGTMHAVGTPSGTNTVGKGVNNAGQVVGYDGTLGAFLYDGTMHYIGSPDAFSNASGINSAGQITGYIDTEDGFSHAFGYDGTMLDLGTLGGSQSFGMGISASGAVPGYSYVADDSSTHAFLYDTSMHDLGALGGDSSHARGISPGGLVTGDATTAGDLGSGVFIYDGTMHDIGSIGDEASGYGINDAGQVVGTFFDGPGSHAFFYNGSAFYDLNDLIVPGSGLTITGAVAINAAGQIVGSALTTQNQRVAVLLTPVLETVPEPGTLLLFAIGIAGIAVLRRLTSEKRSYTGWQQEAGRLVWLGFRLWDFNASDRK